MNEAKAFCIEEEAVRIFGAHMKRFAPEQAESAHQFFLTVLSDDHVELKKLLRKMSGQELGKIIACGDIHINSSRKRLPLTSFIRKTSILDVLSTNGTLQIDNAFDALVMLASAVIVAVLRDIVLQATYTDEETEMAFFIQH